MTNRTGVERRKDGCCVYCLYPLEHPTNKFCGQSCITAWVNKRRARLAEDRLWDQVIKTDTCWLWQGKSRNQFGHGKVRQTNSTKYVGVHRVSWATHYGPVPVGMMVLHHCDVPNCVNPEHLFLGTQLENMRDRRSKGR